MINKNSLQAVNSSTFSKHFCRPLYSSYCFSNIPKAIEGLFQKEPIRGFPQDVFGEKSGPFERVIFLFIDGFGWRFLEKYKDQLPIFKRLEEMGVLSKITSMFPSTTAAHVTCINTGLTPNQSGIYEWFMYEPTLNELIAPLPFSFAGDRNAESLKDTKLLPENLYPNQTLHERLKSRGIQSFAFQPAFIQDSTYSRSILKGAQTFGYTSTQEAFEQMKSCLNQKCYCYFYFGDIDAIGHRKGVDSEEFTKATFEIFTEIEKFLDQIPPDTALLISADHGMTSVSPKNTYYLNQKIPNFEKFLQFGSRNKPLIPAGSCRDLFMHILPEHLSEAKEVLEEFLEGIGEVHFTEELINENLFGPGIASDKFLSRVGNLVILSHLDQAVWWYEKNRFQQNFYAAHGGLTRNEMEIPLFFIPL